MGILLEFGHSLAIHRSEFSLLQFDEFLYGQKIQKSRREKVPYGSDIVSLQSWVLF